MIICALKKIKTLLLLFPFLLMLGGPLSCQASAKERTQNGNSLADRYQSLSSQSAPVLLKKAETFINRNQNDSALLCLMVITSRYKEDMPHDDKIDVIEAYNGMWFVRFFVYFDYAKSYDALMRARKIANSIHYNQAYIDLNFGCFYQTLAEKGKDQSLMEKALSAYRKAFAEAMTATDANLIVSSFGNLAMVSSTLHRMGEISVAWKQFQTKRGNIPLQLYCYYCLLYEGLSAKERKDYSRALALFHQQYQYTSDSKDYIRNNIMMYVNMSDILSLQGKNHEAAETLLNGLALSRKYDL